MFRSDTLFARFMNKFCDVLIVGVLWILFSIPIVTSGAASTAAYYAMAKSVRHNTGYVSKEFWHSFKMNLKQGLVLSILFWVLMASLAFEIYMVWINSNKLNDTLFIILCFVAFLVGGLALYVCPVLSRFDRKFLELLKISTYLFFRYLPYTILGVALFFAMGIGIYLMPWGILLYPGVFMWLVSLPMEKILRKLLPDVEEDSEEAQKWYYQ